jgi:hypothetical protein
MNSLNDSVEKVEHKSSSAFWNDFEWRQEHRKQDDRESDAMTILKVKFIT